MNFETVANQYLHELETSSNPARRNTIASYRSIIRTHLSPRFGQTDLTDLAAENNRALRELCRDLRKRYKPASIQLMINLTKQIIGHPKNSNGVPLYQCIWNATYIDAPAVVPTEQRAPIIGLDELNAVVASHRDRLFLATLAGTGLRLSECLALTQANWNRGAGILHITKSKTSAGIREVDVPLALNDQLKAAIPVDQDRLFPISVTAARDRAKGITGFAHGFRRFRLTHLRKMGMPEDLLRFAMGHSDRSVSDRYSRLRLDRVFRREWVERTGVGFEFRS